MASGSREPGIISPNRVMGIFDYGRKTHCLRATIILLHRKGLEAGQQTTNYFLVINNPSLESLDAIPRSFALA